MKRFFPLTLSLVLLAALAGAASLFSFPFLIYNTTDSLPHGFYMVRPSTDAGRGELAVLRVPPQVRELVSRRGWLREDGFLIKEVAGLPGDSLCTADGVFRVAGESYGQILSVDSAGRPLPDYRFCGVIRRGLAVVSPGHERSFDSRYFGPVPLKMLLGVATPLWYF